MYQQMQIPLFSGYNTFLLLCAPFAENPSHTIGVLPRSSTSRKHGLSFDDSGLIDNRFCGDNDWWSSTWVAKRDGVIRQNTRICQFRLQREQPDVEFETVRRFNNEDRGGYGSTGEE